MIGANHDSIGQLHVYHGGCNCHRILHYYGGGRIAVIMLHFHTWLIERKGKELVFHAEEIMFDDDSRELIDSDKTSFDRKLLVGYTYQKHIPDVNTVVHVYKKEDITLSFRVVECTNECDF